MHKAPAEGLSATEAAWQAVGEWLDAWREAHPDEERTDGEIVMSADYQDPTRHAAYWDGEEARPC
jgi:hypothetical protein